MEHGFRIAAVGELLWDLLPEGPRLGGAPANFAAMAANLADPPDTGAADQVFLISRVGDDPLGSRAISELLARGVQVEHVSIDPKHATGQVHVAFRPDGDPVYTINENTAWDFLPETPELLALASTLDAIYFGTLAQRSPEARQTLRRFVEATRSDCVHVFDVNLRDPWWTHERLAWGCAHATILKMSLGEVPRVARSVDPPLDGQAPLAIARGLLRQFPIELIAITRGGKGSLLITREEVHDHPGVAVRVIDPVGAGDAFTAAMTRAWLRGDSLSAIAESANQWGAWVAAQSGGMPLPDHAGRRRIAEVVSAAHSQERFSGP